MHIYKHQIINIVERTININGKKKINEKHIKY